MSIPREEVEVSASGRHPTIAGVALSVIAMTTFLVLPQFISAVVGDLRFSEQEAGMLASTLMAGSGLASVAAGIWVRRLPWRTAAAIALSAVALGNGALCFLHSFHAFVAAEAMIGFFGGSLYSLALTVLAGGPHPDRSFGFSVAAQVAFQVLGLVASPWLMAHGGIDALLGVFVGSCALGAVFIHGLPLRSPEEADPAARTGRLGVPVFFAFAGCFFFFFNVGCYWTYIELIGSAAGLEPTALANGLATGVAFGIAGGLLASWIGERRGRLLPIGVGAALIVVAALLLTGKLQLPAFVASAIIYNFAWNLSLAFQYAAVNAVDASGRGVAIAPAFHAAGGAAGPAVAAFLVTPQDHGDVVGLVIAGVTASFVCFFIAQRLATRS